MSYEDKRDYTVRRMFDCCPPQANIDSILRGCADWGRDYVLNSVEFIALLSAIKPFVENYDKAKVSMPESIDDFEDEKILKSNLEIFEQAFKVVPK